MPDAWGNGRKRIKRIKMFKLFKLFKLFKMIMPNAYAPTRVGMTALCLPARRWPARSESANPEGPRLFIKVSQIERGVTYELRLAFDHTNPRVPGERTVKIHEIVGV